MFFIEMEQMAVVLVDEIRIIKLICHLIKVAKGRNNICRCIHSKIKHGHCISQFFTFFIRNNELHGCVN